MQSGSDFDVDKLNTFLRNYAVVNGRLTSLKETPEQMYANQVKKLRGLLGYMDRLTEKAFNETFGQGVDYAASANLLNSIYKEKTGEDIDETAEFTPEELEEILREGGKSTKTLEDTKTKISDMIENPAKYMVKYEKQYLQEQLFDLIKERLEDVDRYYDYINPNSSDDLEFQATEINDSQKPKYKTEVEYKGISRFSTTTNIKVAKNLWSAKAGVAQAASHGVFTALTQLNPIKQTKYVGRLFVPDELVWKDEDDNIIFGKKDNTEGKSIIDIIANQHISANVDAANKPFIFRLNANSLTNDLHYYLETAGVPVEWVSRFMTQPIILEYIKEVEKRKGMVSRIKRIKFNANNSERDIVMKVRAMFGGLSLDKNESGSEYFDGKKDEDGLTIPTAFPDGRAPSSKELLNFIKNPGTEQLNLLDDFLFYKEWAAEKRRNIAGVKFDTEGAGKNLPESKISAYKYERLIGSDNVNPRTMFSGLESLVENSILKGFKEDVLELAVKLYSSTTIVDKIPSAVEVLDAVFNTLYNNMQLKPESIYKVYAMLTNIILQNNMVQSELDRIGTGTKELWWKYYMLSENSTSNQIAKLINSPEMKGNYLFDNLFSVDFATKNNEPNIVKFDNTVRITPELETVVSDSFINFKSKYPKLYENMIKMSLFQTGVVQSTVSFYKYIPVQDFVTIAKSLLKDPNIDSDIFKRELIQNMYNIKGLANRVGYKDIVTNPNGLPEFFEVKSSQKYATTEFLTKTSKDALSLYERVSETSDKIRFNKISTKSSYKFYNGLIGNDFNSDAKDEGQEDQEETSTSQQLYTKSITLKDKYAYEIQDINEGMLIEMGYTLDEATEIIKEICK
jgi:hypothetical protein